MENNEIMDVNHEEIEEVMTENDLTIVEPEPQAKVCIGDGVIVACVAYTTYKVSMAIGRGCKKVFGKIFRRKKHEEDVIEVDEYEEIDSGEFEEECI